MSVRYAVEAGVGTLTLASPESRNVLSRPMLASLREHLAAAASDDDVRVIVLTGEGSTFCAGADLSQAADDVADGSGESAPQQMAALLDAMLEHPKPIVARVQGHVAGGGNGLVAAADISVAVESAKLAFTEVRVGVAPAVISVVCLARMSPTDARELLLTGERITAIRAREVGLVTAVCPDDALDAVVRSYIDALLLGGPEALARTKELLHRVPTMPRDEAFAWAAEVSAGLFASAEAREGMTAFFERRRPSWAPEPPAV